MKQDLIFQINERRTVHSDIYSYLHEPRTTLNNENNYGVFDITSKVAMEKMVEIIQKFLKTIPKLLNLEFWKCVKQNQLLNLRFHQ